MLLFSIQPSFKKMPAIRNYAMFDTVIGLCLVNISTRWGARQNMADNNIVHNFLTLLSNAKCMIWTKHDTDSKDILLYYKCLQFISDGGTGKRSDINFNYGGAVTTSKRKWK